MEQRQLQRVRVVVMMGIQHARFHSRVNESPRPELGHVGAPSVFLEGVGAAEHFTSVGDLDKFKKPLRAEAVFASE
jgi:hypothetical protein